MKILTPGHKYELAHYENPSHSELIQFIEKDLAMNTINDGTTNEEVLKMLVDRLNFLNVRLPSRETSIAITAVENALLWLQKRTAERKERGVEGTNEP